MTFALARSLLLADAVSPDAMAQALLAAATRGTSLVRALVATRAIEIGRLEQHLERGDAPFMRHVAPVLALVQHLPPGLCERLLALPVRRDPRTGTIDVAVVDARDPHPVEEMAHWLRAPVRMVRTSLASMDTALRRIHERPSQPRSLAAPIWVPPAVEVSREVMKTPAYGVQALDPSSGPATTRDVRIPEHVGADGFSDGTARVPSQHPIDSGHSDDVTMEPDTQRPNIPFVLTRRSAPSLPSVLGPPAEERLAGQPLSEDDGVVHELQTRREPEPVLELRRRKSMYPEVDSPPSSAPTLVGLPTAAGIEAIRSAQDRDLLLDRVVGAMSAVARKVAVLAVRKDALLGWTCSPELGDRAALRAARITPAPSDALRIVQDEKGALFARIPKDGTHAPLLAAMRVPPSGEVGMVAVRAYGKVVAVVVADEMRDPRLVKGRLEEVAQVAGEATERLLRERRK
jgi:hypothetical protein